MWGDRDKGVPMRVQRVSGSDDQSWTVVRADYRVVEPIEAFLAHLSALDRSPNTVNAYAFDLRDFFVFLDGRRTAWDRVTAEDVALFAGWLRLPPDSDSGTVIALPASDSRRSPATIRRKLAAVSSFYDFHQRRGVDVSASLTATRSTWFSGHRWDPFLSHLGPRQVRRPAIQVKVPKRIPKDLTPEQVSAVLAACGQPRDRLFFTVLADAGLRAGEALGLRHKDLDCQGKLVFVRPRRNANGARVKSQTERTVPVPAGLIRLYSDYLHEQYGDLDSDYVFVNLAGPAAGRAWRYASVHDLVVRLRRRSGVPFTPHAFRHTYATELLRRGVAVEVVQTLMGHSSVTTTSQTYAHIKIEDARAALDRVGWFDRQGPVR